MYRIIYEKQAIKDLKNLKSAGLASKAQELIDIIKESPYKSPPIYEALVGDLKGMYSRRINIKHRLVYQVYEQLVEVDGIKYEGTVKIIRMWTHYDGIK